MDAKTHVATPFVDMVAVEAWDAWFRWRESGRLRDISIDDTWARVARALAAAEPATSAASFEQRLVDSFAAWRLLLDERLLTTAGTPAAAWPDDDLVAVLNAASFVRARCSPRAHFDHEAFADTAALALRALDNAMLAAPSPAAASAHGVAIGLIGVADALALLGLGYDSARGRAKAQAIARGLAEGCLRESARLARERGARRPPGEPALSDEALASLSEDVRSQTRKHGLRHPCATAITSQPRLALFANNVADALDPLLGANRLRTIANAEAARSLSSSGYAMTIAGSHAPVARGPGFETLADMPITAQIELRGAMQPWIDRPITYPIPVLRLPDAGEQQRDCVLAAAHRLGRPSWQLLDKATGAAIRA